MIFILLLRILQGRPYAWI